MPRMNEWSRRTVNVTVRVTEDEKEDLESLAERLGTTQGAVIKMALEQFKGNMGR